MAIITSSVISEAVSEFYDKLHLAVGRPAMVYARWSEKKPLKQGTGKQMKWRRPVPFGAATTPMSEGVTPAGRTFSYEEVTTTVAQYGDWGYIADVIQLTSIDPVLTDMVTEFGEQEALTLDTLLRSKLIAGNNVYYAGGVVTSRDTVKLKLTAADLKKIELRLKSSKAKKHTEMMSASTGYNTTPLEASFIGVVTLEQAQDLKEILASDSRWVPVHKYPSSKGVMEGEVGQYAGIRFVETDNGPIFEGGGATGGTSVSETDSHADVHCAIIFGKQAYAEVPLTGSNSGIIIKAHSQKDTSDTSDPLNQRSTAGWKLMWGGVILNDDWLVRYETAVSA